SKGEVQVVAGVPGGSAVNQKADVEANRTDRRFDSQSKPERLAEVGRLQIAHADEDVAGVGENGSSEVAPDREPQLVVDHEHSVAAQRTQLQFRRAIGVKDDIAVIIALRDEDLRASLFEAETSKIAGAAGKEPFGNRQRELSAEWGR